MNTTLLLRIHVSDRPFRATLSRVLKTTTSFHKGMVVASTSFERPLEVEAVTYALDDDTVSVQLAPLVVADSAAFDAAVKTFTARGFELVAAASVLPRG
jgi:hypothetical protein